VRGRRDAQAGIEPGIESRVELCEVLLEAPAGVGRIRTLDREADHGGLQELLDLFHRVRERRALRVAQRGDDPLRQLVRAPIEFRPFGSSPGGQ
jgi:hypothetical protein